MVNVNNDDKDNKESDTGIVVLWMVCYDMVSAGLPWSASASVSY